MSLPLWALVWQESAVLPPRPVSVRELTALQPDGVRTLCRAWMSRCLPWPATACSDLLPLPRGAAHRPSALSQDMGAGLAVVPLMGLLESIAVAKSFGKVPPPLPPAPPPPPRGPTCLACFHACFPLL